MFVIVCVVADCDWAQVRVRYNGAHYLWYHVARDTGVLSVGDGPTLRRHVVIPDHFVDARLDNGKWVEARVV